MAMARQGDASPSLVPGPVGRSQPTRNCICVGNQRLLCRLLMKVGGPSPSSQTPHGIAGAPHPHEQPKRPMESPPPCTLPHMLFLSACGRRFRRNSSATSCSIHRSNVSPNGTNSLPTAYPRSVRTHVPGVMGALCAAPRARERGRQPAHTHPIATQVKGWRMTVFMSILAPPVLAQNSPLPHSQTSTRHKWLPKKVAIEFTRCQPV